MIRLPLQVGTTATWAAARIALALFPALAFTGIGVWLAINSDGDGGEAILIPFVLAALLFVYAWWYLRLALRARASDLCFHGDGLAIDGGRHGGARFAWTELTEPYAKVEEAKEDRLVLWRLPIVALEVAGGSGDVGPTAPVATWRLAIWHRGARIQLAETDRAIEAESMRAAVSTIEDQCAGRAAMSHATEVATAFAPCPACAAPLVPDDAATVVCAYCGKTVPLPEALRAQAAAAKELSRRQARNARAIARLVRQPGAMMANLWLGVLTLVMIGAWPGAWWIVGARVWRAGWHWADFGVFLLPVAVVIGGFFFARGRLAGRGALQLLALGFGALAPRQEGHPSLCRMCEAPLPAPRLGGFVRCRYCAADNIAGIDLRPLVDARRGAQKELDDALRKSRRERVLWLVLSALALGAFAALAYATARYLR